MSMDINKDKKRLKLMTDEQLRELLCQLETDRMSIIDLMGDNDPHAQYMTLLIDAVCGELLKRDRAKGYFKGNLDMVVGNTPVRPEAIVELEKRLKDALRGVVGLRIEPIGPNGKILPLNEVPSCPDTYYKLMCLGDGSVGED